MELNGTLYDFNRFRDLKQLRNDIFDSHISIKQPKDEQDEMKEEITKLEDYSPTNKKKVDNTKKVLYNAKKLFHIRSRIIKAFEDGIFPLSKKNVQENKLKKIVKI